MIIKEAPDTLEDEDLIEMANAGLIPLTVSIDTVAEFWKQVFPKITVHQSIPLHTGLDMAWPLRKNSPQLKAAADNFAVRHAQGTSIGNQILTRYYKNAVRQRRRPEAERKKFLALVEYFKKYGDQYNVGTGCSWRPKVTKNPNQSGCQEPSRCDWGHADHARHRKRPQCR